MSFIPESKKAEKVPFYEDVSQADGWRGYSTTKSLKTLQTEIGEAINRLGGVVSGFQRGTFVIEDQNRDGFQVHYSISDPNGRFVPGRLDIAALPVKRVRDELKREKSLRMSLFMLREGLNGIWFMQQLSPGYAGLMPWMIADKDGNTVSQLWSESSTMKQLLPPSESDFIDAEEIRS